MNLYQIIKAANLEVAALISHNMPTCHYEKNSLGFGGDLSSGIDLKAEKIFLDKLLPYGRVYSEECGLVGEGENLFIVDPIDGSDNLISHVPYYGTSVARKVNGVVIEAVVANLSNGDTFYKNEKGFFRGSLFSEEMFEVKTNPHSKVGLFERAYRYPDITKELLCKNLKFRSPGATALSLAYAHDTSYMLYLGELRSFDIEAGLFMCHDLNTLKLDNVLLVSQDKEIFDKIAEIII